MTTKTEMTTNIELITPERARDILENNTHNRKVVQNNLLKLTKAINSGQWRLNGDAIRIDVNNVLLDGQHRLMAIVETGVPCQSLVITGLEPDVFTTIDQGVTRSLSSIMQMNGVGNSTQAASILQMISLYDRGKTPSRGAAKQTKDDLLKVYDKNSYLIDYSCSYTHSTNRYLKQWFSPSYAAFLVFVIHRIDADDADIFLQQLITGVAIDERKQALILRERIIQVLSSTVKENHVHRSAFFIQAWNAFRKKKQIKRLRWTRTGDASQKYPRAI